MNVFLTISWLGLAILAVIALASIGEKGRDIAALLHAQNKLLKELLEVLKKHNI